MQRLRQAGSQHPDPRESVIRQLDLFLAALKEVGAAAEGLVAHEVLQKSEAAERGPHARLQTAMHDLDSAHGELLAVLRAPEPSEDIRR